MFSSTAWLRPFRGPRDSEINLPFKDIDAGNKNRQFVTHSESFARSLPNELPPGGVKHIEVVSKRRDVDETGEESIRQFDHQSVIPDIHNCR